LGAKLLLKRLQLALPPLLVSLVVFGLQIVEVDLGILALRLRNSQLVAQLAHVALDLTSLVIFGGLGGLKLHVKLTLLLGKELDVALGLLLFVFELRAVDLLLINVSLELKVIPLCVYQLTLRG